MAAIDSLLGIAEMKKAGGVALASDEVPALLTGGGRTPLTMPALSATMVEALLQEVLTEPERESLTSAGLVETQYRSAAHGLFAVKARLSGQKVTLTVKKGAAPAMAAAPTAPIPPSVVPVATAAATAEASPLASAAMPRRSAPTTSSAIARILAQAVTLGASDVVLSSGRAPALRRQGSLQSQPGPIIEAAELMAFFQPLLGERAADFQRTGSVDLAVVLGDGERDTNGEPPQRFRANLFRHAGGMAAALRPVWSQLPTLQELGLPVTLTDLVRPGPGLVVLAGPTGTGKSTTLAALIEHIDRTRACHIVTLEDPVEYLYRPARSLIHQREVGRDVDGFASGLRAALRERPDVLLVGEMRDPDTIRLALTAAETGHLVLTTLHSGSAAMAIERMLDAFGHDEKEYVQKQLAGALRAVAAQLLLPAAATSANRLGLVPVLEILTVNHAVAAHIREGRTHMLATQMEIGAVEGMVPLDRALADLVRAGRVSRAAALAASAHPDAVQSLLEAPAPRSRPL